MTSSIISPASPISYGSIGTGYYNIIDATINSALIAAMSGQKIDINKKTIMYIILFASIGEIKEFVKWFFTKLKTYEFSDLQRIINYLTTLKISIQQTIQNMLRKIQILNKSHPVYPTLSYSQNLPNTCTHIQHTTLHIGTNHKIIDAILSHIHDFPSTGTYNYKIIKSTTIDLQTRHDKLHIYNITLNINENLSILIKTELYVTYDTTQHMIHACAHTYNNALHLIVPQVILNNKTKICSLSALIDNKHIVDILDNNVKHIKLLSSKVSQYFQPINANEFILVGQSNVTPHHIIGSIKQTYYHTLNAPMEYLLTELIILMHYANFNIHFTKNNIHFDSLKMSIVFDSPNFNLIHCETSALIQKKYIEGAKAFMAELKHDLITLNTNFNLINDEKPIPIEDNNIVLSIECYHSPTLQTNPIIDWNNYLHNEIIKHYISKQLSIQDVTVHTLKIKEHIEEKEIPNPEFQAYTVP